MSMLRGNSYAPCTAELTKLRVAPWRQWAGPLRTTTVFLICFAFFPYFLFFFCCFVFLSYFFFYFCFAYFILCLTFSVYFFIFIFSFFIFCFSFSCFFSFFLFSSLHFFFPFSYSFLSLFLFYFFIFCIFSFILNKCVCCGKTEQFSSFLNSINVLNFFNNIKMFIFENLFNEINVFMKNSSNNVKLI